MEEKIEEEFNGFECCSLVSKYCLALSRGKLTNSGIHKKALKTRISGWVVSCCRKREFVELFRSRIKRSIVCFVYLSTYVMLCYVRLFGINWNIAQRFDSNPMFRSFLCICTFNEMIISYAKIKQMLEWFYCFAFSLIHWSVSAIRALTVGLN